ncbi:SRPBCC domain-containing protein [Kibdelosporangium philippinense]|uniref:SRPBCC domain-containing protein n=1 Tax=Kibdelosporangium philippinense TaxID=211113 RepID=A0ABS8ZJ28_9PSEU|nr:SRPBCC domain-containing protein [Kibdelosporangium philippinense]MCE7006468.1 SRPBCC domain-containing protein [Kibdelosporangium philippinense]
MIGQTKDVGFQIGVSKTLPYAPEAVWAAIMSDEGVALWLGRGANLVKGQSYETEDGTVGKVRSRNEVDRVRVTWRPKDWDHETTVQIAISANAGKTRLTFHQERMADPAERERQREHWRRVMADVVDLLTSK